MGGTVAEAQKPRLNGIELELRSNRQWYGEGTEEYVARTKEIRVKFTKDGTIDWDIFAKKHSGEDIYKVSLNFRQDGKLNTMTVLTHNDNGWRGDVKELEEYMKAFLGHEQVTRWLKDMNLACVEEAKKDAEIAENRKKFRNMVRGINHDELKRLL